MPANPGHASLSAWTSPTALLAGFLFVAACGYLAAVYLTGEADRRGDRRLQAYFTWNTYFGTGSETWTQR